jgi:hypothetical protein
MRSNGFPSGHTDLNGGHPGLKEDFLKGVLVSEVPSAPLGPEVVEEKVTKNVKRLPRVSEAVGVISEEPGRVVLSLGGSLPEKDERPGKGDILERFPIFPNSLVSFPSVLRHGALEQAMLGRFFSS